MRKALILLAVLGASLLATPGAADAATGELGALGTPLAQATFAGALTAGPDGDVWFSAAAGEFEPHRVVGKVTAEGQVTEYTAPEGAASIVAGADGNLWFAETGGVGRITPAGEITSFALAEGVGSPAALTPGPGGNVWFVTGAPAVGSISPSGGVTMFPLTDASAPSAIAAGPAGDLWFTEPKAAQIGRVTAAGVESEFKLPAGSRPTSITAGPDGNLWFSDAKHPRVGRITPAGKVSFFPVPTLTGTDKVYAGPGGSIWFTATDEIGTVSTAGKASWPACFSSGCGYPPTALTTGPDGSLWIASGVGHCTGYCGGGSEQSFAFESGSIGPYSLPSVTLGIGPRLPPVLHDRTSIVVGCGDAGPCSGTLRLRALVRPPGGQSEFHTRLISQVHYSLAAGAIQNLSVRLPVVRWERLRYGRGFLIVDAIQGGSRVAKRGFYFSPKKGGILKQFF